LTHVDLLRKFVAAIFILAASAQLNAATQPNVVIQWNQAILQGVRDSTLGPPMVARALAVVHTCMYDAWTTYDARAVGTQLGGSLRRPAAERTLANKNQAISFAAYRAAINLFPWDKASVFDPLMAALGYDTNDTSTDTTTPPGIGTSPARPFLIFAIMTARISWGI
jgi:hypothetical protein